MITNHRLPAEALAAFAGTVSDVAVVKQLRGVQHSKHLMLLHAVAENAHGMDPARPEIAAFLAGFKVLEAVQHADPDALAWLFGLPQIGGWEHDCLARMDEGRPPDFGYLASAAAAAAVRARVPFQLDVPVSGRRVLFPGLGYFHFPDVGETWVRLRCDGERLAVATFTKARCADMVPDDGSGSAVPHWQGAHEVWAKAGGRTWQTLLENTDHYLDRYMLPMSATISQDEVASWRDCLQRAWEILISDHSWAAEQVSEGVSAIIPLTARSDTELESATTPMAFGAIATCRPPTPVIMAEILIHESQHLKLCGLLDVVPFMGPCEELVYAPWRMDPRPASGLLQGVYAHLGIARFWNAQRRMETEPDEILRAQVAFERWRSTIEPATTTLLRTGCLTPTGARFVTLLRDQGRLLEAEAVPADAKKIARVIALDHRLSWQLRHSALETASVAELASAYQRGQPLPGRTLPEVSIAENARKINPSARGQLLSMRYLEPRRSQEQNLASMSGLGDADRLLIGGQATAAVEAYRDEIMASAEPMADAWAGLALAIHLLPQAPVLSAFAARLPLMFDVHACLYGRGIRSDPLQLAAWFA